MKIGRKFLLTTLSIATLATVSIFGTLAYFTDSDSVTNTFTVGHVKIDLDEADVKPNGEYEYADSGSTNLNPRVQENKYHLLPGHTYIKDPTVHVEKDSEDCYVFVTVANGIKDIEAESDSSYKEIEKQMDGNGWKQLKGDSSQPITKDEIQVWYYINSSTNSSILSPKGTQIDLEVFGEFKIAGDKVINREDTAAESSPSEGESTVASSLSRTDGSGNFYIDAFADAKIIVNAYAVQADGFDTPLKAWNATFGK